MADSSTFARQLLAQATPSERTLGAPVAGLRVATRRIEARLVPALGPLGVRMIMARALRAAAARHPFPSGLNVYEDGVDAGSLLGQRTDEDYDQVWRSFEDLLAVFIEQLVQLVGKNLAVALVREDGR